MFLDSYNENLYIACLDRLTKGLSEIEKIYNQIETESDFKNIDSVIALFDRVFNDGIIKKHLAYSIERIYKPLYLSNPGPHSKGNSYWHINLGINSAELSWLDQLYDSQIQRLLKLYKHTFSKIDNFLISHNPNQIRKYQAIISDVKKETETFLEYSNHREIIDKKAKLDPQKLTKIPFGGLFYTAHIDNIESILELGILSHNIAHSKGLVTEDISDQQVNARRNRIVTSLGKNIHDFAPLYFNPKNPMLYRLCKTMNRENLILLKVNPHILLANDVAFSDGNAATSTTKFYNDIQDFNRLNWSLINKGSWNHYEYEIKKEQGRIMCSEVLVKDNIPCYYITDLFTFNQNSIERILPMFPNHLGINISINNKMYF